MNDFKVGDRVADTDPGLAMMRQIMGPGAEPNHYGTIQELWAEGALVQADDGYQYPVPYSNLKHLKDES